MLGIAGIVDFNSATDTGMAIKKIVDILNAASHSLSKTYAYNQIAFGVVQSQDNISKGLISEDEDNVLAFFGILFDTQDLIKRAGKSFDTTSGISQLLLSLYKNEGFDCFYSLNGRFIVALWDKKERVLRLLSDRYGFCKLFYWASSDRILFSSEYKAIIWHEDFQKKVDEEAIADFMALGYCLGDKTFFENIKLLPHGSVLTFHDGKMSITRYWDYTFRNGNSQLYEFEEYINRYYALFEKACRRQILGQKVIGLPLSGGLDSRALAGMLNKLNFQGDVKTFSYGNLNCFDVVYGKRIAGRIGYMHEYIPIESTYLRDNAKRFVWLTEGTVNCLNAHMMLTHRVIRKGGIDAVITGFLGDTVGGEPIVGSGLFKEIFTEEGFIERLFNEQSEIMSESDAALYLQGRVYERVKRKTFASFQTDYLRTPAESRYCKSIYAELIGRQRRYTSFNLYAFNGVADVLAPFTDNEFVDFALQIPEVLAFTRFVQREMIARYLSEVASVPWNKTRLPLNASRIRKGLHWRWERLNRNPLIRATIGRRYAKMNDNYINSAEAIRTGSKEFVVKHIKNNPFLAEYFNMDRIHQLLDDHMSRKCEAQRKIIAILTLSLWHTLFIEGEGFRYSPDVRIKRESR